MNIFAFEGVFHGSFSVDYLFSLKKIILTFNQIDCDVINSVHLKKIIRVYAFLKLGLASTILFVYFDQDCKALFSLI